MTLDDEFGAVQTNGARHRHQVSDRVEKSQSDIGFFQIDQLVLTIVLVDHQVQHLQSRRKPVHFGIERPDTHRQTNLTADD